MFRTVPLRDNIELIKFGGGVNPRRSEDDIDPREASEGGNFDLDVENANFEPRRPFALRGAVPSGRDIRGFAQVVQQDGTISSLIQAGEDVYTWDGGSTFTLVGTVDPLSQLRGHRHHNFILDDAVLITDIALKSEVMNWDGVNFSVHTTGFSDPFKAKYCYVEDNRAWFANVISGVGGIETPHMIVASERENAEVLSVANVPSSSLGDGDAFYILTPDYRPLNGMTGGLNRLVFSSKRGNMYSLTGTSSKDFAIQSLYNDSAATGDEGLVFAGNDFIYGRSGFIESLAGSERFGDIDNDNVSRQIENIIEEYDEFRLVYNQRRKKLFVLPNGSDTIYVFHKPLYDKLAKDVTLLKQGAEVSPWVPWTTDHPAGFEPSCIWSMLDPVTGLEEVFFGGKDGSLYQMDGEKGLGDGGTTAITSRRVSKTFVGITGQMFDISGWARYRSGMDAVMDMKFRTGGKQSKETPVKPTIPDSVRAWYFGGDTYFGDDTHWNSVNRGRMREVEFSVGTISSELQVDITVQSKLDFSIAEIGFQNSG